jgi:hypothetical protein
MANTTITKILCRRGPEADREDITPTMGEPIWTTDTHRFYIGDGAISGGRPIIDVDDAYFKYEQYVDDDGSGGIQPIPASGSTRHNILTFKPTGILYVDNLSDGCNVNVGGVLTDGSAIRTTGGISCDKNLHAGMDVISFCTSDAKFKDNVQRIDSAIDKIKSVRGVTFTWNSEQDTHQGEDTGVIAQEIEALELPGICTTREDGSKAIKYERLVPLLIEGIKELSSRIDQLENEDES